MWISARSRETIVSAYAQAATDLFDADPIDPDHTASRLLEWCATTSQRWLIVLDDLQRPEDLHRLWPPSATGGRMGVTTRRRDPSLVRADRPMIDVGVFTSEEAHAYLAAKLADHPHLADDLDGLAADLGWLPLALAMAYLINRSVADRELTCARYRIRLADRRRTLRQVMPSAGELPDDHYRTVDATFALSIELANELEPVKLAGPSCCRRACWTQRGSRCSYSTPPSSRTIWPEC
jgi:hypothetical protein